MSSTDWLYDFLMQTFRSPSWEVPIMNWIDEHCIIFDNVSNYTVFRKEKFLLT